MCLGVLALALLGGEARAATFEIQTKQVTEADVDVSPDGKQLAFTILGHLFRVDVKGGVAEQLTFGASYDNDPAFSPDGRSIAFVSDRDGSGGNVFLLDLATRKLARVTHESHAGQPVWTPDGKAIIYLRFLPREQDPRRASIFRGVALSDLRKISLDSGAKPEVLRGTALVRSVFYLPSGQLAWTIVEQESTPGTFFPRSTTHIESYSAKDRKAARLRSVQGDLGRVVAGSKGDGLYVRGPDFRFLPLRNGEARRIAALGGGSGGGSSTRFAVTADGKFAYLSGRGQLLKVALEGGERQAVELRASVKMEVADPALPAWTPPQSGGEVGPRSILGPQLSPDGRSLTFMAAGFLWQQKLDGTPARLLVEGDAWAREPALSPDGRKLAFVRSQAGRRELRILDADTGQTQTIADLKQDSWARFPSWSGDGKRLVFQKSGALYSPFDLVAANLSDGKLDKLANAAGDWSSHPQFSVGGDALYFTSRISNLGAFYRLPLNRKAEPKAITQLARHLHEAHVSPNDKWLAFRRNSEIWVAPMRNEPIHEDHVRRLSPEGGATFEFTPDSAAVIYAVGSRAWRHPLGGGDRQEYPVRLEWRCPEPPPLLVRGVRVLDLAAGKFGAETSLLIERGTISWIGPEPGHELPAGVVVLEAAGKYAIPGLFDFHVHSAWANHDADPDTFLAYGITSVRDTGGSLELLGAVADRGDTTGAPVPRYFYSGEIFEGAQPIWGDAFLQVYTAEEARDLVGRWKARGAHFIKVYPSLPWPLQRAVAEEARRQGLPVAGHGLGLEEIVKSVTLGYSCLEHCPMSLNDDLKNLLVAAGTRCDPTLAILGGHSNLMRKEPKILDDAKLRTYFSESFIRSARGGGFPGTAASWAGRLAEIRAARRGGVKLHAGTDSLMTGTFFGASLHWELAHLVEAGLEPIEVLRLATQDAAAAVGAERYLGTLEPNKLADLLVLDADPLSNIRNTGAIWRVVKGGWAFDPKALRAENRTEGTGG
jgi:Tol biopolymer transport system component/imidazolonepropionase-like amidohydrolase